MKPINHYIDITLNDDLLLTLDESRNSLKRIDIAGQIISTPGHSEDSVTLILDAGLACTGDLPGPDFVGDDMRETVERSWQHIRSLNVQTIYPGQGPVRPMPG